MDFRPATTQERERLAAALRRNAGDGAALLLDRRDTSFVGTTEEVADHEVITAIKSVPCHYAGREVRLALAMLRESPEYVADARVGAPVGNSVAGSLLSLFHGIPRQYAEPAVVQALRLLDAEEEVARG